MLPRVKDKSWNKIIDFYIRGHVSLHCWNLRVYIKADYGGERNNSLSCYMLPVLIQSMHELQVEPYTMGMQFYKEQLCVICFLPHLGRISSVSVIKLTKTLLRASPQLSPISSLDAWNSSYRCVPQLFPAWATYIIFCTTYIISAFLHLSMSHILDWRILFFFFWWGLSCFCRMFSPISGLYLLNASGPHLK